MSSKRSVSKIIKLLETDYEKYSSSLTVGELVSVLTKLSEAYYNEEPLLPDLIYDQLRELLEDKDPENSYLSVVGTTPKSENMVRLPYEMGSLTKIKPDTDKLQKWMKEYKGQYVVSDKLDGCSVQLYKNNKGKVFLYSRGTSIEGQDISKLIKYVVDEKLLEEMTNGMSIRGELIITKKDFEKIKTIMKNARNAVSGLVNSKNTINMKVAKITRMVAYSILYPKYKQSKQMEILEGMSIEVVDYNIYKKLDENVLKKQLIERRTESKYVIDGLVCVDDSDVYEQTGGFPKYMFSFKMTLEDQMVETTINKVIWEISKDGYLKPTVEFDPVELGGVSNEHATANNAKFVVDNKLGKGSKIIIQRANDVIPKINTVLSSSTSGEPDLPDIEYKWSDTKIDIIAIENNEHVKTKKTIKLLYHFFKTLKVKHFGEETIVKFVENGYNTVSKILKANKTDLEKINGVGSTLITKIYSNILDALQETSLARFMDASQTFGRNLGTRKFGKILAVYPNILKQKWTKEELYENILKVDGFGKKFATLFSNNFNKFIKFYNEISKIVDLSRFENEQNETEEDSLDESSEEETKILENQKIVVTGFRDDNLEKCIVKNGGKMSTSVSKNTTMVIYKDEEYLSSNGKKIETAKSLGIKIISKNDFIKKYCK